VFIDGSIIRAHQHSTGAATTDSECIGKSRGGNSTKMHLAVDSNGFPIYFELSEGQRNDIIHAQSLVEHTRQAKTVMQIKDTIVIYFGSLLNQKGWNQLSPNGNIMVKSKKMLIGAYINIAI
jgi:hypothetical protein